MPPSAATAGAPREDRRARKGLTALVAVGLASGGRFDVERRHAVLKGPRRIAGAIAIATRYAPRK